MDLARALDHLEAAYGPPPAPVPRSALDWVLWENVAYLAPDDRRERLFKAWRKATRLTPHGILSLPREELFELAEQGGMQPDRRVEKLLDIATTVEEDFGGDLDTALDLPLAKAKKALRRFPGIGEPGAEKILLFTGRHALPALESNGLRVLCRLGLAREQKDYRRTYLSGQAALEPYVRRGCEWLQRAHLLLRRHGQELCKNTAPDCDPCPLARGCPSAE